MNVNDFVRETAFLAKQRVAQASDAARLAIKKMAQPYQGFIDPPMMYAMPAAGGAYTAPGVFINQTAEERGFEEKTSGGRLLRRMMSKSVGGPQMKGLMDTAARKYGSSTFTMCSNHAEESGSKSLTDSSSYVMWADDFEHEGL
jgi:hypothetical protein